MLPFKSSSPGDEFFSQKYAFICYEQTFCIEFMEYYTIFSIDDDGHNLFLVRPMRQLEQRARGVPPKPVQSIRVTKSKSGGPKSKLLP